MRHFLKWTFLSALLTQFACSSPPEVKSQINGFAPSTGNDAHAEGVYDHAEDGSPVLRMIEGAQSSIDIEIYELNDPTVRRALVQASQRGVPTRIVIEPAPVGVCNVFKNPASENDTVSCKNRRGVLDELSSAGVKIVPFNKELCGGGITNCYQHGKLLLVDRKAAMISTGNFNGSSFCNEEANPSKCNRDYSVVTRDSDVVMALHNIFEKDFAGQPYDLNTLLTPGVRQKLTVSPVAEPNLIGLINSSQRSLQIQAQYLKEPELNAAIQQAAQRGVKVEATLASTCAFSRYPKEATKTSLQVVYDPMIQSGVDMQFFTEENRIKGKRAYMHAKVILADDSAVWIGSINGSTRSTESNREFGLILRRSDWIAKVKQIVTKDMQSPGNEDFASNLNCVKDRKVDGANPSSSTGDEPSEEEIELFSMGM